MHRNLSAAAGILVLLLGSAGCITTREIIVEESVPVGGYDDVNEHVFVETLSPYGTWVNIAGVGLVWQPSVGVVGPSFVPYATGGQWMYTGSAWVFDSTYPFGWVTFHYGNWYFDPFYNWVWYPGYTWAPAWVHWRYGGGYIGWAPIGPTVVVNTAPAYVFVPTERFVERNPYVHALPASRAHVAMQRTDPVGRAAGSRGPAVVSRGPPVTAVSNAIGRPVRVRQPESARVAQAYAQAQPEGRVPRITAASLAREGLSVSSGERGEPVVRPQGTTERGPTIQSIPQPQDAPSATRPQSAPRRAEAVSPSTLSSPRVSPPPPDRAPSTTPVPAPSTPSVRPEPPSRAPSVTPPPSAPPVRPEPPSRAPSIAPPPGPSPMRPAPPVRAPSIAAPPTPSLPPASPAPPMRAPSFSQPMFAPPPAPAPAPQFSAPPPSFSAPGGFSRAPSIGAPAPAPAPSAPPPAPGAPQGWRR